MALTNDHPRRFPPRWTIGQRCLLDIGDYLGDRVARTGTDRPRFYERCGGKGGKCMRHERVYARRQRAVTFAGSTRTITIPLEMADFERLERLAIKHNLGNATLGREIIRKYLSARQTKK
jgi:hypothetical protein